MKLKLLIICILLNSNVGLGAPPILLSQFDEIPSTAFGTQTVLLGNIAIFSAKGDGVGVELWKTDGSSGGTVLLKDINPGIYSSDPSMFFKAGNLVYFRATTNSNGTELWKTDGTTKGTVLVKDIATGKVPIINNPESGSPRNFFLMNGMVIFSAYTPNHGFELWKSNGTSSGTSMIKDISAGPPRCSTVPYSICLGSSSPESFFSFKSKVYFIVNKSRDSRELWRTDGTPGGTVFVQTLNPDFTIQDGGGRGTNQLHEFNGRLYFTGYSPDAGLELWSTDGSNSGTQLLKDIRGGQFGSSPKDFIVVNKKLFFTAFSELGRGLWVSDGTLNGTQIVKDLSAGQPFTNNYNFSQEANQLKFDDGTNLWISDGTSTGTFITGRAPRRDEVPLVLGSGLQIQTSEGDRKVWKLFTVESPGGAKLVEGFEDDLQLVNPYTYSRPLLLASKRVIFFGKSKETKKFGLFSF